MDAEERRLWPDLRSDVADDVVVLRGLVTQYYGTVYRFIEAQFTQRFVQDGDAVLDLCDATFRAFFQRLRMDRSFEPESFSALLLNIAEEKVAAFFSVLPFTSHKSDTAPLDDILRSVRDNYHHSPSDRDVDASRKRPRWRRWYSRLAELAAVRSKILQFGVALVVIGALTQLDVLQLYLLPPDDVAASMRPAPSSAGRSVHRLSIAEREEGRKPWLGQPSVPQVSRTGGPSTFSDSARQDRTYAANNGRSQPGPAPHRAAPSDQAVHVRKTGLSDHALTGVSASMADGHPGPHQGTSFLAGLRTSGEDRDVPVESATEGLVTSTPRHPRDPEFVHDIVIAHNPAVQDCYKLALKRRPDLQGKLVVRFTVSQDGKVAHVEILSSNLDDAQLERCVLKRIRRWNDFPPAPPEYGEVRFLQEYKFGIE